MNKLLLLVVIVVFLVVGVLVINVGDEKQSSAPQPVAAPVQTTPKDSELSEAEKDTYVNTIKTINANYRDLEKRFEELVANQKEIKVPTNDEIAKVVNDRVADNSSQLTREFTERLNKIKSSIGQPGKSSSSRSTDADSDEGTSAGIPAGFGFDGLVNSATKTAARDAVPTSRPTGWSTVMPMGAAPAAGGKVGDGLVGWASPSTKARPTTKDEDTLTRVKAGAARVTRNMPDLEAPRPAYTIPRNATLFSNDTLTALLGVIPVEGSILDPIRFKVITGNTNMATNGLYIPGVRNIVWSGIAVGNREMSCVRGELYSVTFTFEDGTIRTISSAKSTADTKAGSKQILGYISDRQGSPCLKGRLITNASDYLRDRIVASSAGALAGALATTQQTTIKRNDGSIEQFFDGSTSKYIGSKALSGGASELTDYLRERARNAVDLVFLEAGQEVVLHVEDQIEIDYEPNGRKLEYAQSSSSLAKTGYHLD